MSLFCCVFQVKTTELSNGLVQDEFERTNVNMSTYLVAFIVANFTSVSQNVSGINVGILMTPLCCLDICV